MPDTHHPAPASIILTDDQWAEQFKPQQNPLSPSAPWSGQLLETYGPELALVEQMLQVNPDRVWTVIECDGITSITNGFQRVNRIGYIITEVPAAPNTFYEVIDPDDLLDDQEDEEDEGEAP